jgi:hypothetical protein
MWLIKKKNQRSKSSATDPVSSRYQDQVSNFPNTEVADSVSNISNRFNDLKKN